MDIMDWLFGPDPGGAARKAARILELQKRYRQEAEAAAVRGEPFPTFDEWAKPYLGENPSNPYKR